MWRSLPQEMKRQQARAPPARTARFPGRRRPSRARRGHGATPRAPCSLPGDQSAAPQRYARHENGPKTPPGSTTNVINVSD